MSIYFVMPALKVQNISPTEKLVLVYLAERADNEGVCYPKRDTIAYDLDISLKSVDRAFKVFLDAEIIEYFKDENGRKLTKLLLSNTDKLSVNKGQIVRKPNEEKRTNCPINTDKLSYKNGQIVRPYIEPSITVNKPSEKTNKKAKSNLEEFGKASPVSKSENHEVDFDLFWNAYPNKKDKSKAKKIYFQKRKKHSHEQIMRGLEFYKKNKEDWKAWKMPTTFLNAETFLDVNEINNSQNPIQPQTQELAKYIQLCEQGMRWDYSKFGMTLEAARQLVETKKQSDAA